LALLLTPTPCGPLNPFTTTLDILYAHI